MNSYSTFYLCPICFEAAEVRIVCHEHPMIRCADGRYGAEERKPLMAGDGSLRSHAPRWFLKARGWTKAGVGTRSNN